MRYENQTFGPGTSVTFDDNEFIRCTFSGCALNYSGGAFTIIECQYGPPLSLNFHEAARRTAFFLKQIQDATDPSFGTKFLSDPNLMLSSTTKN